MRASAPGWRKPFRLTCGGNRRNCWGSYDSRAWAYAPRVELLIRRSMKIRRSQANFGAEFSVGYGVLAIFEGERSRERTSYRRVGAVSQKLPGELESPRTNLLARYFQCLGFQRRLLRCEKLYAPQLRWNFAHHELWFRGSALGLWWTWAAGKWSSLGIPVH